MNIGAAAERARQPPRQQRDQGEHTTPSNPSRLPSGERTEQVIYEPGTDHAGAADGDRLPRRQDQRTLGSTIITCAFSQ